MTETAARLDWLSFSMVDPYKPENSWENNAEFHANMIYEMFNITLEAKVLPGRRWQPSMLADHAGSCLFYGEDGRMTLEVPGKVCAYIQQRGEMQSFVEKLMGAGRCTRVDIAVDMKCDTDPREFVEERTNKRQKSHETAVSSTGTTCYIGSRKSQRYARVYRYADPHPRADLLRCEMVFRGKQAEKAIAQWAKVGDLEFAARAGNIYGWKHKAWDPKVRRG